MLLSAFPNVPPNLNFGMLHVGKTLPPLRLRKAVVLESFGVANGDTAAVKDACLVSRPACASWTAVTFGQGLR
jgi:hypothetical protein